MADLMHVFSMCAFCCLVMLEVVRWFTLSRAAFLVLVCWGLQSRVIVISTPK